jgi:hypothetical protein
VLLLVSVDFPRIVGSFETHLTAFYVALLALVAPDLFHQVHIYAIHTAYIYSFACLNVPFLF